MGVAPLFHFGGRLVFTVLWRSSAGRSVACCSAASACLVFAPRFPHLYFFSPMMYVLIPTVFPLLHVHLSKGKLGHQPCGVAWAPPLPLIHANCLLGHCGGARWVVRAGLIPEPHCPAAAHAHTRPSLHHADCLDAGRTGPSRHVQGLAAARLYRRLHQVSPFIQMCAQGSPPSALVHQSLGL